MAIIDDEHFIAWLKLHPEERENACKRCAGEGWADCLECWGTGYELDDDGATTEERCDHCQGGSYSCDHCGHTGLACYLEFKAIHDREERLLREWNEGLKQKSPVSSMAVVAADSQVALGYSSETGS